MHRVCQRTSLMITHPLNTHTRLLLRVPKYSTKAHNIKHCTDKMCLYTLKYTLKECSMLELMTQLWLFLFFFLPPYITESYKDHPHAAFLRTLAHYYEVLTSGIFMEAIKPPQTHTQFLFTHTCRAGSNALCPQCINTHREQWFSFDAHCCMKCVFIHKSISTIYISLP